MLTIIALIIAVLFLSSPWNVVLVVTAAIVDLAETGGFVWWSRRRRRLGPAAVGAEAIVGRFGVALERLDPGSPDPVGQVRVDGEIWTARAAGPIDPGASVIVTGVDGLVLEVAPQQRERAGG
jgi:membrane protein implicated in regulation of membrane protease activity